MTLEKALYKAKRELEGFVLKPYQESLWILSKTLNISPEGIYLKKESLSERQKNLFFKRIFRRRRGEPLEYILREKIFFGKSFYVKPGVFIPREDTEILAQWVFKNIGKQKVKALDFGAGVGNLCLTLLSLLPESEFAALEISKASISCLQKNSQKFQAGQRLHIIQKDVRQAGKEEIVQVLGDSPSLIVSNPPYIDCKDRSIAPEVYWFEPPQALFSNQEGMGCIYAWFKKAMEFLRPGGLYLFEFGWNQGDKVKQFLEAQKILKSYRIYRDKSGHPRMALCFKKELI